MWVEQVCKPIAIALYQHVETHGSTQLQDYTENVDLIFVTLLNGELICIAERRPNKTKTWADVFIPKQEVSFPSVNL